MEWLDFKLPEWWVLLIIFWLSGFAFFRIRKETRPEAIEYWEKLKDFSFWTFLVICMGGMLWGIALLPVGLLVVVTGWMKKLFGD